MNNLPKIKNKKGDLTVIVFVFLTLALFSLVLFSLGANKKAVEARIFGYEKPNEMFLMENEFEYRLMKIGEECLVKSYDSIIEEKSYVLQPIKEFEDKIIFDKLNPGIKEKLIANLDECIKEKLKEKIDHYETEEVSMLKSFYIRTLNTLEIGTIDNQYKLNIFEIATIRPNRDFKYSPNIEVLIHPERIGLFNFEKLEDFANCGSDVICTDEILMGNQKIEREIIQKEEVTLIEYKITTVKEFLIDNKFQSLEINFLVSLPKIEKLEDTEQIESEEVL